MSRLRQFAHHRFVGTRDTMIVYDCDDEAQFAELERRIEDDDLLRRGLLSSFAPDSLAEARNRSFTPRRRTRR